MVGVLDPKNERAAILPRIEPVEESGADASDVKVSGRGWRKTDARFAFHGSAILTANSPSPWRKWEEGITEAQAARILRARCHAIYQRLQVREASTGDTSVSHFTLTLFIVQSMLGWARFICSCVPPASTTNTRPWAVKSCTMYS